jgi:uncharacterized membrane protein
VDLRRPEALLLLPLVLFLAWRATRGSLVVLAPWRSRLALGLRALLLTAIVLALAEARAVLPRDELQVVFCVDRSRSLDEQHLRFELDWVKDAARGMGPGDRAGLVLFGENAQVERGLGPALEVPHVPSSIVDDKASDLGRAIRLAVALLPDEVDRQIVLLSDGNENTGDVLREARVASANGVRVTTVHVPTGASEGEVLIERVDAPPFVERNEPFLVRASVIAKSAGHARVTFERNGRLVGEKEVELQAGRNSVPFAERLDEADAYTYKVTVYAPGDRIPANNLGTALVRVLGQPRALIVLREKAETEPLARVLEAAGMKVDRGGAAALPVGRDELARYDLVVVGDVAAERWSQAQLVAIRDYVRDMGGGLLALGGEESFGLGGFYGTPFEEALPVDSDIRRKKVLPSLGLVLCMDKSGSMSESTGEGASKMVLAREGAVRVVELLAREDMLGVVGFDETPEWIAPLGRVENKVAVARALRNLEPGGGTAIQPALLECAKALEKAEAQVKHILLLTDGISEPGDFPLVLEKCRRAKITLSTVGVGDDVDQQFLEDLARRGGGQYYFAKTASEVPRLFTKDALSASRSLLIERPTRPVELRPSELPWSPPPPLLGYVLTEPKDGSEVLLGSAKDQEGPEEGPILARWRFGIGKSAAFTSDATARWSKEWIGWPGYDALFANLARWLERDPRPSGLSASLDLEAGKGVVTVEADERSPLALEARVSVPSSAPPVAPLKLEPVAPGRYRGTFPANEPGAYFAGVVEVLASGARVARGTAGAVLAYPREYRDLVSNPGLLERVARVSGGKALSLEDRGSAQLWAHGRAPTRAPRPLLPWLVIAAAIFLVLEVAARRLSFPERQPRARVVDEGKTDAVVAKLLAKKAEEKKAEEKRAPPMEARAPTAVVPPPLPSPVREEGVAPDEDSFTALLKAKRRARKDESP